MTNEPMPRLAAAASYLRFIAGALLCVSVVGTIMLTAVLRSTVIATGGDQPVVLAGAGSFVAALLLFGLPTALVACVMYGMATLGDAAQETVAAPREAASTGTATPRG